MSSGQYGRQCRRPALFAADAIEDVQIEEVHAAEYEQNKSDFERQVFDCTLDTKNFGANLKVECDVAQIDEIESYHEKLIDRTRQPFVSAEGIFQKGLPVFEKSPGYPYRQSYADQQVAEIGPYNCIHRASPWVVDFERVQKYGIGRPVSRIKLNVFKNNFAEKKGRIRSGLIILGNVLWFQFLELVSKSDVERFLDLRSGSY